MRIFILVAAGFVSALHDGVIGDWLVDNIVPLRPRATLAHAGPVMEMRRHAFHEETFGEIPRLDGSDANSRTAADGWCFRSVPSGRPLRGACCERDALRGRLFGVLENIG